MKLPLKLSTARASLATTCWAAIIPSVVSVSRMEFDHVCIGSIQGSRSRSTRLVPVVHTNDCVSVDRQHVASFQTKCESLATNACVMSLTPLTIKLRNAGRVMARFSIRSPNTIPNSAIKRIRITHVSIHGSEWVSDKREGLFLKNLTKF